MIKHLQTFSKITFSLSIIFSSSICLAGIYKWVDDQGNVHYGQQRPVDKRAQKMDVQMHAPRNASSYNTPGTKAPDNTSEEDPANPQDPDAKDETAKKEQKPPAETAAEKKNRLAACAQERKRLATMQNSGRVRSKDKDGNITYLSDEQKNARIKSSRDLINKRCK